MSTRNRHWRDRIGAVLIACLLGACDAPTGSQPVEAALARGPESAGPTIVVANRGAGTISVIDARADAVVRTVALPGPAAPEPMYVVYAPAGHMVLVGDRANDCIVAFDARTFAILGTVVVGDGVFHMWAGPSGRELWVVDDIGNAVTVVDTRTLTVTAVIPMPEDLQAAGAKPHDVILDPLRPLAFVTMVGVPGPTDLVLQFDRRRLVETRRAAVGDDPHLSLARQNRRLFVPAQNGNAVHVLNRLTLAPEVVLPVPGAHGAGMTNNGRVFYTTNLPGGGAAGLMAIDGRTLTVIGAVDTPFPVPHNITTLPGGRKIYVTHSGAAANQVSVYRAGERNGLPTLVTTLTVGTNPFGLAFVP